MVIVNIKGTIFKKLFLSTVNVIVSVPPPINISSINMIGLIGLLPPLKNCVPKIPITDMIIKAVDKVIAIFFFILKTAFL